MKPVGIVRCQTPKFDFGKRVLSKPLTAAHAKNKSVGIIHASTHHSEMPQAEFKYSSKKFIDEDGEIVSGTEMLGTANGVRTGVNGATIMHQLLSPLALRNTKLYQRCHLWNRYRFKKIAFEYIPTVAATVGGELTAALTVDPVENPSWETANGDAALRKMMGYSNAVTLNSYTHAHVSAHFTPADDQWYYIGEAEDPRLEYQGEFMLQESIQPTGDLPASGWQYGIVRVHYEIEFCGATTDVTFSSTTEITGTWTVTSGTLNGAAAVKIMPTAPSSGADYIYCPTGLAASANTNGVWCVTLLTSPSNTLSWSDASEVAVQLGAGTCFYIKSTVTDGLRAFSSVPGLQGDSSMDDSLLRWGTGTASTTFTAKAVLVSLVNDAPV